MFVSCDGVDHGECRLVDIYANTTYANTKEIATDKLLNRNIYRTRVKR